MSDEFDLKLVTSAFALAAEKGWRHVTVAAAAREAGLDLGHARKKFSGCHAILKRFGQLADAHALDGALTEGPVKDRLFDSVLRRFDFLQMHRAGVLALLRTLPLQPELAAWLATETLISMGWLLEGAGVSSAGIRGHFRKRGLLAVWAWGLRAWVRDETEDLSATMAAVDVALTRADQIAARFAPEGFTPETEDSPAEPELPLDTPD
ncbi:MAG: TetR family transcriptional regulator [Acidocella sp.]|nr:TetR family transcriptional regulator [Acidocella sp.]